MPIDKKAVNFAFSTKNSYPIRINIDDGTNMSKAPMCRGWQNGSEFSKSKWLGIPDVAPKICNVGIVYGDQLLAIDFDRFGLYDFITDLLEMELDGLLESFLIKLMKTWTFISSENSDGKFRHQAFFYINFKSELLKFMIGKDDKGNTEYIEFRTGSDKQSCIPPSICSSEGKYQHYQRHWIIEDNLEELTEDEYNAVVNFIKRTFEIKDKKTEHDYKITYKPPRKAFVDILNGDLNMESQSIETGVELFRYFSVLYSEFYQCGISLEEITDQIIKVFGRADRKKIEANVKAINKKGILDHRLSPKRYKEYFPTYDDINFIDEDELYWNCKILDMKTYNTFWGKYKRFADGKLKSFDEVFPIIEYDDVNGNTKKKRNGSQYDYVIHSIISKRKKLNGMTPFIYDLGWRSWFVYEDKHWKFIDEEKVKKIIFDTHCKIFNSTEIKNLLKAYELLKKMCFCGRENEAFFQTDIGSHKIAFKNKLLIFSSDYNDYEECELDPREKCITIINANFDKTARCPQWKKSLKQWFENSDGQTKFYIESLLTDIAYTMISGNKHQYCIMLLGEGGNGKSALLDSLQILFKDSYTSVYLDDFGRNFGLQGKLNKLLVVVPEVDCEKFAGMSKWKAWIGNNCFNQDLKGEKPIVVKPIGKIWESINEMHFFDESSIAFSDRIKAYEFQNIFRGTIMEDPDLIEKLTEEKELSGLVNIVLPFLSKIKKMKRALQDMRSVTDVLKTRSKIRHYDFFEEMIREGKINHFLSTRHIFQMYRAYALSYNKSNIPNTLSESRGLSTKLAMWVKKHMKNAQKTRRCKPYGRGYMGLKFNPELINDEMIKFCGLEGKF